MDLRNYISKVVRSRCFYLSESFKNYWHTIFMTGEGIKTPKEVKFVSVEFNLFLKSRRHKKVCIVMINIQVKISDSKEIQKY